VCRLDNQNPTVHGGSINNLITAKEEGAAEAARRMIDEIDGLLG
jgi:hypothetical protein